MTPHLYKANTERLRAKPWLATLIGVLLLVGPWGAELLHGSDPPDGIFVGVWGAWMYGCSLWWSKEGVFNEADESRWLAALTLDFCMIGYIFMVFSILVGLI